MDTGITREQAIELLRRHIRNENMIKHCLASEAVLAGLADRLGGARETWAMAGLLHDLDVEITGLIMATALVYPDKKLASVKPKSIVKRMKEKAFAASVNRNIIRECEKCGIPLHEFVEICITAMQGISGQMAL